MIKQTKWLKRMLEFFKNNMLIRLLLVILHFSILALPKSLTMPQTQCLVKCLGRHAIHYITIYSTGYFPLYFLFECSSKYPLCK